MRIGGIASGMDTEQMIRDLMRAERVKVDKLFRQEETFKWRRDALNTTNKTLAEFILKSRKDFGLTRSTSTGTIYRQSTQNFDWVKKATSSNENIAKVTASANAMAGTHKIKVEQLADVAKVTSGNLKNVLNNNSRLDATEAGSSFTIATAAGSAEIKLENAKVIGSKAADLDFSSENLTIRVNGKAVTLTDSYSNVTELADDIQTTLGSPEQSGITVSVEEGKLKFTSVDPIVIESSDVEKLDTKLGLKNGMTSGKNSINDIVNQINNATTKVNGKDVSLGLRAAYDSDLGKLMITTKEQGEEQKIIISGNLTDILFKDPIGTENLTRPIDPDNPNATFEVTGKNAQIKYNGETIEKSSNNFSIFGINLQLQSVNETEEVTINVDTNVDSMYDKIKAFVDDYNALIDNINGLLKEKSYRDFKPLTKEEKEAMKEKEIELWEEKAKSGLLRNDESLTRMLQTMRNSLYENVFTGGSGDSKGEKLGGFNHITQIGITTGNYQSGGRLEIDEQKLRQAINDNPEGVINLMFKTSDINVPEGNSEEARRAAANKKANSGLIERIYDDMINGMKDIVRRSGTGKEANLFRDVQSNMLIDFVTSGSISVLDKELSNLNKRIANEERILMGREDRYWRQFTAMEKALEKMNSQSGWLMSQLGQMGR